VTEDPSRNGRPVAAPVFDDGPFADASVAYRKGHDPTLLVRREATLLRRRGVRFFRERDRPAGDGQRRGFRRPRSHDLRGLRLSVELWRPPASDHGHLWRSTLLSALRFAFSV
jgi:hypothetical protein